MGRQKDQRVILMQRLVVNGCSYMETYALGGGHRDLADRLGIAQAETLAIGGSANSRILRTTLKHSYQTAEPTLYVMGLTFVSRSEIPICTVDNENTSFEGRWINPQNQEFSDRWEHFWNRGLSEQFVKMKLMTELYSLIDRTEDLMYQTLSAITNIQSRGHGVLVYQQADDSYHCHLTAPRLKQFQLSKNIIDGFSWCAIQYQHSHGVVSNRDQGLGNFIGPQGVPENICHRAQGEHHVLNEFLVDYVRRNNII
jgi:hypothetical protein